MEKIKILILAYDPDTIGQLQDELKKVGLHLTTKVVGTRAAYEKALGSLAPDVIVSDYSLPSLDVFSAFGIRQQAAPETPFVVVAGPIGEENAVKLMKMGVRDYVLREKLHQLTPTIRQILAEAANRRQQEKTQGRHKHIAQTALEEREEKYHNLFDLSPTPMWVYAVGTLRFLDVNEAAILHYGYSKAEFLAMTLKDIRPPEEVSKLEELAKIPKEAITHYQNVFKHVKKNGEVIVVEIKANRVNFSGRAARLVIATDISERIKYIQAIQEQNRRLQEIAWTQSHIVRAPLARLMGLVGLLHDYPIEKINDTNILALILDSAHELDGIIREIVRKSEHINILAILQEPHKGF
jgi:PAS domain S-box-containing protein